MKKQKKEKLIFFKKIFYFKIKTSQQRLAKENQMEKLNIFQDLKKEWLLKKVTKWVDLIWVQLLF